MTSSGDRGKLKDSPAPPRVSSSLAVIGRDPLMNFAGSRPIVLTPSLILNHRGGWCDRINISRHPVAVSPPSVALSVGHWGGRGPLCTSRVWSPPLTIWFPLVKGNIENRSPCSFLLFSGWDRVVSLPTESSGRRGGRIHVSQPPAKPRRPPSLYGPLVGPGSGGTESRPSVSPPSPASSAGTAVFASAVPLVILFLSHDLLTKEDHRPPGFSPLNYGVNNRRGGEILPHYSHQSTALLVPSWTLLQSVLRRVHRCAAVATCRALPTDPSQEFSEASVPRENLRNSVRDRHPALSINLAMRSSVHFRQELQRRNPRQGRGRHVRCGAIATNGTGTPETRTCKSGGGATRRRPL